MYEYVNIHLNLIQPYQSICLIKITFHANLNLKSMNIVHLEVY